MASGFVGGRRRAIIGVLLTAAVAGGVVLAFGPGSGAASNDQQSHPITVSATRCAPGWLAPHSGQTVFNVTNTSKDTIYGVDIVGANQLTVYGEIEMLAPGTEVPLAVVLPPGQYSFECEAFSGVSLFSSVRRVRGPAVTGAHPYTPVDAQQVQLATLTYRASLMKVMTKLESDTDALRSAVAAGKLSEARTLWLPAHLDYERLGAAYDTFGNFNSEINGRPLGLVGGVDSPQFTGFLRLEYGLWHGQSAAELEPVADALDSAVHGLVRRFPEMLTPANDLSLRTHEILENTLQFELTGETDEGSNTNLATAWANVQGTQLALGALQPLLQSSDPSLLSTLSQGLSALGAAFKSYELPDGHWTPLQSLTTSERAHLDGETSALLEQLSAVPDLFDLPIRPANGDD